MADRLKILAVIPARGGSKGLPGKNIKPLAGKPLLLWTIEAAKAAKTLDHIVVSTDDAAIASMAKEAGIKVINRPAEYATDTATTKDVLLHAVNQLDATYDAVMTLQPTSLFRTAQDIDEAATLFFKSPDADSLVSIVDVPHHFHPQNVMREENGLLKAYDGTDFSATRRQDRKPVFARNGAAIYITRTHRLKEYVFGGNMMGYKMPELRSLDINTPADFEMAEIIAAGMQHARR